MLFIFLLAPLLFAFSSHLGFKGRGNVILHLHIAQNTVSTII